MVNFYSRNEDDKEFDKFIQEMITNPNSSMDDKISALYVQNQQILSILRELSDKQSGAEARAKILR